MDNRRKDKYFEEEVDDDEFLRHSKTGSGYLLPSTQARTPAHPPASGQQGNSFGQAQGRNDQTQDLEKQRQLLAERRRDIEERTLASSERGLGLLYESEKVGAATADELSRQKEQLMRTEQRLDDINSTLRNSEKHIQGIRSVFGAVRNYFGGRSQGSQGPAVHTESQTSAPRVSTSASVGSLQAGVQQTQRYQDGHPGLRTKPGFAPAPPASVDDALDRNLDDMAAGLSRLKGLAQGLNSEMNEHNDILDRVNDKSEDVGFKVQKQNKAMEKILKK